MRRVHVRLNIAVICLGLAMASIGLSLSAQRGSASAASASPRLFLLASYIEAPILDTPVSTVLYRVSQNGQLIPSAEILKGTESFGAKHGLPDGVFSIHEVGDYMVIEYPHDVICCAIFIPEHDPLKFESVNINFALKCGLGSVRDSDKEACETWQAAADSIQIGSPIPPKMTLLSVCKKPNGQSYLRKGDRDVFRFLRFDGMTPADTACYLSAQDSTLSEYLLGAPSIPIASTPPEFSVLTEHRRFSLDAANERYLVVSLNGKDLIDRNTDVFAKTTEGGKWSRLPVLPVGILGDRPENMDRMRYRLFDDWLVTSASAELIANSRVKDTVAPDVLTVVATGKQWADWGIDVKPRTAPDVATPPARRITLWNLADNRRVDLAIPEGDSEIVHIFDNQQVLLRIHDKLFFATIHGSNLVDYKIVAFDSAIPRVHWAWYAENGSH